MKRRTLSTIIILFIGIVIGFAIALLIGALLFYLEPDMLLTNRPKTFGDIEILAIEPFEDEEDDGKVLMLRRNKVPFLYAEEDKDGKVRYVSILDGKDIIRFMITASKEPGKWRNAMYAHDEEGHYTTGEKYVDINFDGQFDGKYFFDDTGKLVSKHIYLNKAWRRVESLEKGKAILDQKTYVFSNDFGWVIHQ